MLDCWLCVCIWSQLFPRSARFKRENRVVAFGACRDKTAP